MATSIPKYPPLHERPLKNTICLFDVDDTLCPLAASAEMLDLLARLRQKCAIGFVGDSDYSKQQEQLGNTSTPVTALFDFCFSENGLTAFKLGEPLPSTSFIKYLGEDQYKELVNFALHYIADLDVTIKRGIFIEFRNGMVNISPVGRNASAAERVAFQEYDRVHGVRQDFIAKLRERFGHLGLEFAVGGQISFDIFPTGWDKTYCLRHLENEAKNGGIKYDEIHFFGDKTAKGGNDYEIYVDKRTTGYSVTGPGDTMRILREMFDL
ncbi:putative phosphomannomutase [Colletotrichum sublineola]|uniref:Phosphomannomutase n=1 Tax=Colletotrichum sublineola TaxID=1173701 RepID=A0A066WTV2_COLSU|nr:putative phosphomannomutase [Colletotrichum sublineola]